MFFGKKFCRVKKILTFAILNTAKVAQLVERDLAKVEVAGSRPVFRSNAPSLHREGVFLECPMPRWWNW